jgi:hypothetical protein
MAMGYANKSGAPYSASTLRGAWEGKVVAYVGYVHLQTELPKFLDDAPSPASPRDRTAESRREHVACSAFE